MNALRPEGQLYRDQQSGFKKRKVLTPVSPGSGRFHRQSGEPGSGSAMSQYQTSLNSVRANNVGSPVVAVTESSPATASRPEDQPLIQSDVSGMHRQPVASIHATVTALIFLAVIKDWNVFQREPGSTAPVRDSSQAGGIRSPTCPSDGSHPDSFDAEGPERIPSSWRTTLFLLGGIAIVGHRCGGVFSSKSLGSDYASRDYL